MLYRLEKADLIGSLKQKTSSEGKTMDRKDVLLALIFVCLLGIVGKMDYQDAQAENQLKHRAEVTR